MWLGFAVYSLAFGSWGLIALAPQAIILASTVLANADGVDEDARPDVLAQVQADAATTWRSSAEARATVRGPTCPPYAARTTTEKPGRTTSRRRDACAARSPSRPIAS